MKLNIRGIVTSIAIVSLGFVSCDSDDTGVDLPDSGIDFSGTFFQNDQMGRPAVNTVFVSSDDKDRFNLTVPSTQASGFQRRFQLNLEALSPAFNEPTDQNALGQTAEAFTTLLATDVLNVATEGTTTFFDGTNVLTGRDLADDVIDVELLLIFGGEDGTENPGLTSDNVDANDKEFLTSFPYLAAPW